MHSNLEELIKKTSELSSLPSTTMQLMSLLDDETVEANKVLEVIEKDPSLTANLLKLANSAFYGLRRQVGSAREALVLLGNQTIVNLAFATSMGDVMRGPLAAYRLDRNQLWHHALGTALAATYLASQEKSQEIRQQAFTAGLVHDIGKLLLNRPLKKELDQLPPDSDFTCMLEAEKSILGFNHAEAGARLGENWNFPPYLVHAIEYHHEESDESENNKLIRAVAAANLVTCHLGWGGGTGPIGEEGFWAAVQDYGYNQSCIEELLEKLPADLENMLNLIGETL
ncbi:MAG: HDOD domain-containing protein [bacterium]|nr:HDOD domain-containing protein [bacterium]